MRSARASLEAPQTGVTLDEMLPDVRDGLTRLERVILHALAEAEREFPGRSVPSALLYGRVVESIQVSPTEFQRVLTRLVALRR